MTVMALFQTFFRSRRADAPTAGACRDQPGRRPCDPILRAARSLPLWMALLGGLLSAVFVRPQTATADVAVSARVPAAPHADALHLCLEGRSDLPGLPGTLVGTADAMFCRAFVYPWRYRTVTYELYFDDSVALARTAYALALHARDVSPDLPRDTFVARLLGYHWSVGQICAWLNAVMEGKAPDPVLDEGVLAGRLLADRVLVIQQGRFAPGGAVRHVLAAAAGKRRTFAATLRHERLHVYWDEDAAFRAAMTQRWEVMPAADRATALRALGLYNADNPAQLLEEWAVRTAEASPMDLR